MKIEDLGEDDPWSFKDQCGPIDDYQLTENTGLCQHGAENRPDDCGKVLFIDYSTEDSANVPVFDGIWDMESAGNQWTGDNAFYYNFKLYGRHVTYEPFDAEAFCDGKATGTYLNANAESISCDNDSFNGGWTKIFTYHG